MCSPSCTPSTRLKPCTRMKKPATPTPTPAKKLGSEPELEWRMPESVQTACGVRLEHDIPLPVVDLTTATRKAKRKQKFQRWQPADRGGIAAKGQTTESAFGRLVGGGRAVGWIERGLGLKSNAAFHFLDKLGRRNVECVAQVKHQTNAGAVAAQFNQRNVVAIDVRAECQVGLAPLSFGSQAAKCLS